MDIQIVENEITKLRSKCGNILLKSNFYKNKWTKDEMNPICKNCYKSYYPKNYDRIKKYHTSREEEKNIYERERRRRDINFRLIRIMDQIVRNRTNQTFKDQKMRKLNETNDLLGCCHSFFERWIIYQLYGNMNAENYGSVWTTDHCLFFLKLTY